MAHSYLLAGCRTPIGKFQGSLAAACRRSSPRWRSPRSFAARAWPPSESTKSSWATCSRPASARRRPGRRPSAQDCPYRLPHVTVNKVCGSGLKAVMLADQAILRRRRRADRRRRNGKHEPGPLSAARSKAGLEIRRPEGRRLDVARWPLVRVGRFADGGRSRLHRREPRRVAGRPGRFRRRKPSPRRCAADFTAEIVPVIVPGPKATTVVLPTKARGPIRSGEPWRGSSRPSRAQGTVTAGNASQLSDGAAAVIVASAAIAQRSDSPLRAADRGLGHVGRRSQGDVHRAGDGDPARAGQSRPDFGRHRSGRIERGLCRTMPGLHAAAGLDHHKDQRAGRRHRLGASDRRQRSAGARHAAARAGRARICSAAWPHCAWAAATP